MRLLVSDSELCSQDTYVYVGKNHTPAVTQGKMLSNPVVQWLSYSPLDPRFAGSIPAGVDEFFESVKILSMTSFAREVKPWGPVS